MELILTSFSAIRLPKEILFDKGQRDALPAASGRRALVCTDDRLATSSDFERMVEALRTAGLAVRVYGRVLPDLPCDSAAKCADEARHFALCPRRHDERPGEGLPDRRTKRAPSC
jgi:alcohol dehydrogenase